jgi:hypothetical protein
MLKNIPDKHWSRFFYGYLDDTHTRYTYPNTGKKSGIRVWGIVLAMRWLFTTYNVMSRNVRNGQKTTCNDLITAKNAL